MIVSRELGIRTVDTISVQSYDHQSQSEARSQGARPA
jgi:xanthine phosphoribosyltransferase